MIKEENCSIYLFFFAIHLTSDRLLRNDIKMYRIKHTNPTFNCSKSITCFHVIVKKGDSKNNDNAF